MQNGTIIEYIDKQKIIVAVVLEIKNTKVLAFNEMGKEINIAINRLTHISKNCSLEINKNQTKILEEIKEIKTKREEKKTQINIKKNWEFFSEKETKWINIQEMTDYCFCEKYTDNEEAAVIRAFFDDRVYFKFKINRFLARKKKGVKEQQQKKENDRKKKSLIDEGSAWIKKIFLGKDIDIKNKQKNH